MKTLRLMLALAPLCLGAACASGPFAPTTFASTDSPDEARAYSDFMIARVAALTNDPQAAARHYALAIGKAPPETAVAERAVFSALLAGNYGVATGLARRADAAGSDAGLVRLTLAVDAISRDRPDAAIEIIEAAELKAFNRMIAQNLEAWSRLSVEGPAAAEAVLKQNRTGDDRLDNVTVHMIGFVQAAAGNDEAALQTFEAIWGSGARLAAGAEVYAGLLAARGERDKALAILEQFSKDVGDNAALADLKGHIQRGEAIAPMRLTTRQGAAFALYLPASTLMAQTGDDVAAIYFVLAIALDPDLQQARLLLAQTLLQGDRRGEAIRVLSEVPEGSPHYAQARGQLAKTLVAENRTEEALKIAADALAAGPDRSLKLQVADLYRAAERDREAEVLLSEIIATDETDGRSDWRVYFIRGAARERQADWTGAEADLQRALDLQPENATVLNFLGYSWIDRGVRLEEGFGLIRQAVALEPKSGHIIDSLGWAHYQLGQYEEAVDALERAVELLPGDAVLNDHLGDAYWQAGRRKEAGFQWERALKLDPDPEDRAAIERKLLGGIEADPPSPGAAAAR